MLLWPLASGSSGNATLISSGDSTILVDDGISTKRVAQALAAIGKELKDIDALFISHEHHDHVRGLEVLAKRCEPAIFSSPGTAAGARIEKFQPIISGQRVKVKGFSVEGFSVPHDAEEPLGFLIEHEGGNRMLIATDVGHLNAYLLDRLGDCDAVVIDSNHDVEMLTWGNYPPALKERVLGPLGHLSNDQAGEVAVRAAATGAKHVVLAHMSADNNHPELAMNTVAHHLKKAGRDGMRIMVAPRDVPGEMLTLE